MTPVPIVPHSNSALDALRQRLRLFSTLTLVPLLWLASAPQAEAQELPVLGLVKLTKRGDTSPLAMSRIEDTLRQQLEATGTFKLVPAKVMETGKAAASTNAGSGDRAISPAIKALEKADKLVQAARDVLSEAEPELDDAAKLVAAAVQRYEQNFVELADFSKLVDAYQVAAQVALSQQDSKASSDWLTKALIIQPSFVVDGRKQNRPLKELTDKARQALESKPQTQLTVECKDSDADVFVDGVKIGHPPAIAKELTPGTHYVQVRKNGSVPWGQALVAKGKPLQVRAVLQAEVSPENEIGISVSAEDLREQAYKGTFADKPFKNTAGMFARQVGAGFLLMGLLNRRATTLELHLYLYNVKTKKTCAIERLDYSTSLNTSNLQMQAIEAESRVKAAAQTCMQEVTTTPAVFAGMTEEVAAPAVVPTPPDDEAEVQPPPKPRRVEPRTEVAPEPRPQPQPLVRQEPEAAAPSPKAPAYKAPEEDPYARLLKGEEEPAATSKPFYKTWWFWTGVGVLAAGAGTGIYLGTQGAATPGGFSASIQLP